MIMTTTAANYHCQQLPEELLRRCFGLKGESDGKSSSLISLPFLECLKQQQQQQH